MADNDHLTQVTQSGSGGYRPDLTDVTGKGMAINLLKRILLFIDENLERYLCIVILFLMLSLVFYQVVLRYLFNSPNAWSEELARYLFIYFIFICCGLATKKKNHVRIDVFLNIWPQKIRPFIEFLGELAWLVFCILVLIVSARLTRDVFNTGQLAVALRAPLGLVYMALPIGYSITIIRLIQIKIEEIRAYLIVRRTST